jgi:hypothetical protein
MIKIPWAAQPANLIQVKGLCTKGVKAAAWRSAAAKLSKNLENAWAILAAHRMSLII